MLYQLSYVLRQLSWLSSNPTHTNTKTYLNPTPTYNKTCLPIIHVCVLNTHTYIHVHIHCIYTQMLCSSITDYCSITHEAICLMSSLPVLFPLLCSLLVHCMFLPSKISKPPFPHFKAGTPSSFPETFALKPIVNLIVAVTCISL